MRRSRFLMAPLLVLAACADNHPLQPSTQLPDESGRALVTAASIDTVMSGLNSPRGLAWGPGGALYVAEAGTTVAPGPCAPVARGTNCYSGTGSISRLLGSHQERILSGLPSVFNPIAGDIIGPNDISFMGPGNAFVTIGWGAAPAARAALGELGHLFGSIIKIRRNGQWSVSADVAGFEAEHNPGGGHLDSNPFGLLAVPNRQYVADAGGNSLVEVTTSGKVSLVATFPPTPVPPGPFNPPFVESEAVPTEVTRGPDGALYVSTLSGVPFLPGAAKIYRVVPGAAPQVYAEGFTQITDFDWGPDGSLYVVQYASAPFFGGPGALIHVAPNGDRTTVTTALFHATGVLVGPDGAVYVSDNGNLENVGQVLRIVP
ncbi:MAG: ScyD/ScyE family protein [Gemmatimonadota bacterium]|nr:ScyD/ScyE family protein [Gemmatimonadota bacterium]